MRDVGNQPRVLEVSQREDGDVRRGLGLRPRRYHPPPVLVAQRAGRVVGGVGRLHREPRSGRPPPRRVCLNLQRIGRSRMMSMF